MLASTPPTPCPALRAGVAPEQTPPSRGLDRLGACARQLLRDVSFRADRRGFSVLEAVVALLAVVALAAVAAAGVGRASTTLQQHTVRLEVESLLSELARDSVARGTVFSVELLQRHVCTGSGEATPTGCAPWATAAFDQIVVDGPSERPGQLSVSIAENGFRLAVAVRAAGPEQSAARCLRGWVSIGSAARVHSDRHPGPCEALTTARSSPETLAQ